ncbi:MAG: TatD family hydrolase, partial [Nitrososphaeraceae archaeon]
MQYFDSHLHLTDDEYSNYLNHIIFSLRCLNITVCSVTVNLATSKKSLALFNHHRDIINQFIGIHPEFAIKENVAEFTKFFENNLKYIDGVGEIGLDPKY